MNGPIVVICLAGALFVARALHYATSVTPASPRQTSTASEPNADQDSELARPLLNDATKNTFATSRQTLATSPGALPDRQAASKDRVSVSVPPQDPLLEELANLKRRLRLGPNQIQYWPAVESALRNAVKSRRQTGSLSTQKMQELVKASTSLLLVLNEEQKREARHSARKLGLDDIASLI
jgi:hypothetical protein